LRVEFRPMNIGLVVEIHVEAKKELRAKTRRHR